MKLSKADKQKWVDPIIIKTRAEAARFLDALERAAAFKHKKIDIKYKEITDPDEIKQLFLDTNK